jgi:prolyl-tRNA editing enzyme YbaK/EbsC (Cys-tRNA(Pro) deacylase)
MPRTPDDLQKFLDENSVTGEIIHLTAETPTVAAAADALNVSSEQIVKTVLFLVDGKPYAVLANGTRRIDRKKLATHLKISPKRVKLADGEQVLLIIGYAPGTVPPIGHSTPVDRLLERSVLNFPVIYAGGGGIHALLKMTVAELQRATNAIPGDFLEEEKDSEISHE